MKTSGKSLVLAITVDNAFLKGKELFLMAIVNEKVKRFKDVQNVTTHVLEQYRDVIPLELTKHILFRSDVDHRTELLSGSKSISQPFY